MLADRVRAGFALSLFCSLSEEEYPQHRTPFTQLLSPLASEGAGAGVQEGSKSMGSESFRHASP